MKTRAIALAIGLAMIAAGLVWLFGWPV